MPSPKASSTSRWSWALRGLVLVVALSGLAFALFRRGAAQSSAAASAAASAAPRAHRSPQVAVTARPRAGVSGRVLDPEGKPVAKASVCAFLQAERGLTTVDKQAPRCTSTDKQGAYALADLYPATPIGISAAAAGFAPTGYRGPDGLAEVRLGDGERRAGVDILLRGRGVALKGSVNDVTGGGVAGAIVMTEEGADRAMTQSDAKGEFTLWVEPGPARVGATAPGYAPGWAHGPAPAHFFKINLVPGATLVGRTVIAGDQTPVPGVMVDAIPVEGSFTRSSTRTDEEGRFRIEGLSPGRYRVEATSEGREGYSRQSVTLGLGETSAEVVVELDPAFVVRGRVVDKASGEPCKAGRVVLTDPKQNEFSEATIEPDGWARMASVIPGTYRVEVSCKDHIDRDDYPKVTVKDRDLLPLTWEVDKGATVRVEVVDGQSKPVTKANVWAFATQPEGSTGESDHPEADGTFLVAGLKPGSYNVSVHTSDGGRADKPVTVALGHEERVKIELPSSGAIEGIVEDDAHRPVPNVPVGASGPSHASTTSLDDGTFSMPGLPSGDYEVKAGERFSRRGARDAKDPDAARVVKVNVSAPDRVRIKVTVEARSGVIEGKVVDATGKAVTDAFIDFGVSDGNGGGVSRYGSNRSPIVTDTEGHFTVDGLADGTYGLRAHRQGGGEATLDPVKVGARDVVLKMGEGGSIAGTLTARGAPVERFTLSARHQKTGFHRSELFFHAAGSFALGDLPAGTYQLDAETPAGTATAQVTLAEGEQKTGMALTLTLRGVVEGRLVDLESGAPIAGARFFVDGQSPASPMINDGHGDKSGADGRFRLEGVLPGNWGITASSPDPMIETVRLPLVVPEGSDTTDIGTIRVPRRRVAPGEQRGELGVYFGGEVPATVRGAYGPAAEAGLQTGDVVVSVDGFDVQGNNGYLLVPLTVVAPGRTVTFNLAGGRTVRVVARGS